MAGPLVAVAAALGRVAGTAGATVARAAAGTASTAARTASSAAPMAGSAGRVLSSPQANVAMHALGNNLSGRGVGTYPASSPANGAVTDASNNSASFIGSPSSYYK